MRMCGSRGLVFIAFGAGLITALLFPHKFTFLMLAAVLIAAGIGFCRY